MHMCTVATTPPFDTMKVAAAVLTASNCRETVSLFAKYTSSKGGFNGNRGNPSGSATDAANLKVDLAQGWSREA